MAFNSLTFPLNLKQVQLIKQWNLRVTKLFNVEIEYEDTFPSGNEPKQWISLKSKTDTEEECQKAKDYILAILDPEISISIENRFLTKKIRDEIEHESAAYLVEQNGVVTIKGRELGVAIAESLFRQKNEEKDPHSSMKMRNNGKQNVHAGQGRGGGHPAKSHNVPSGFDKKPRKDNSRSPNPVPHSGYSGAGPSVGVKPHTVDKTPPPPDPSRFKSQSSYGRASHSPARRNLSKSPSRKPGQAKSPIKMPVTNADVNQPTIVKNNDSCLNQMSRLKNFGLANGYSIAEIEETFIQFDMNDIIKTTDFRTALVQLREINESVQDSSAGKSPSKTHNFSSISLSDKLSTSSSSVHRQPLRRPQTPPQPLCSSSRPVDDNSPIYIGSERNRNEIIVISSDEENESGHRDGLYATKAAENIPSQFPHSEGRLEPLSSSHSMTVPSPPPSKNPHLRYIVIDGSNVAMSHGNNKVFSVRGIQLCLKYFLDRGHNATAFVPQSRLYSTNPVPISNKDLLQRLNEDGYLQFTPARRIGRRVLTSYDDRYILNLADKEQGIVVSRDQYRDLLDEKPTYRDIIENRLLQFVFVGDHFMPPDDPLGRNGPTLEEFLRNPGYSDPGKQRSITHHQRGQPFFGSSSMGQLPTGQPLRGQQPQMSHPPRVQQRPLPPRVPMTSEGQGMLTEVSQNTNPRVRMPDHRNAQPQVPGHQQPPKRLVAERTRQETTELFDQLKGIFPEENQERMILSVLNNHKSEKDIALLSNYCLNTFTF